MWVAPHDSTILYTVAAQDCILGGNPQLRSDPVAQLGQDMSNLRLTELFGVLACTD